MINNASLSWSRTVNGFEFSVCHNGTNLIPSSWGRYQISYGDSTVLIDALFRECDEELRPTFLKDKVICSDQFIATLTEIETKQLNLPVVSQAKLKVTAEGLISRPGFKLNYRLLRPEGRPFLGATINGSILQLGNQQQLILDPLYSIIKRIDYFNAVPAQSIDERFVRWGEVQELLPENSVIEGQLSAITICRADRLTLDINDHGIFNPLLIKPSTEKKWDVQSQSDVEYAIPKAKQKEFEQQFKKWNSAKATTQLVMEHT